VLWLFPLAVGVVGLLALAFLASRARRELAPTVALVDRFGREHRVALVSALDGLRDETAHTRSRLSGD
jgi:cytochrome c-type biogenesis protein CcmH/NrfF